MAPTSSFRGVSRTASGAWKVRISEGAVERCVGMFNNELDAARAYDRAAKELHNAPVLNFGEDGSPNPRRKIVKSSSYRGVSVRGRDKWEASISIDRRKRSLGVFKDEVEAARAYDRAVRELKVERALNFPSCGDRVGTVASTAASSESDGESLWSSREDSAGENELEDEEYEDNEEEGEEEEGHSDDDHFEGVKQESPSLQPRKRLRIHDRPTTQTPALPVAPQSLDMFCFTDTTPESTSSDPPFNPTTSSLASASSASSTTSAPTTPPPPMASSPSSPKTATHASVSIAVAPAACTHDAITQLRHVVTAARIEARSKEPAEQQGIVRAFAFLHKREMQEGILEFAERTITNAFAPLDTRREKDRALLLQLFIEAFLVES